MCPSDPLSLVRPYLWDLTDMDGEGWRATHD